MLFTEVSEYALDELCALLLLVVAVLEVVEYAVGAYTLDELRTLLLLLVVSTLDVLDEVVGTLDEVVRTRELLVLEGEVVRTVELLVLDGEVVSVYVTVYVAVLK